MYCEGTGPQSADFIGSWRHSAFGRIRLQATAYLWVRQMTHFPSPGKHLGIDYILEYNLGKTSNKLIYLPTLGYCFQMLFPFILSALGSLLQETASLLQPFPPAKPFVRFIIIWSLCAVCDDWTGLTGPKLRILRGIPLCYRCLQIIFSFTGRFSIDTRNRKNIW